MFNSFIFTIRKRLTHNFTLNYGHLDMFNVEFHEIQYHLILLE